LHLSTGVTACVFLVLVSDIAGRHIAMIVVDLQSAIRWIGTLSGCCAIEFGRVLSVPPGFAFTASNDPQ